MDLVFYKLHCLTEDYILINTNSNPELTRDLFPHAAAAICKRRTGAGASGVIFLTGSGKNVDVELFLAGGANGYFRSNAVFCASRYLFDSGLVGTDTFSVYISGTESVVDVIDSANFRLSLGKPANPGSGSFLVPEPTADYTVPLIVAGKQVMVSPIQLQDTFLVHITNTLKKSYLSGLTEEIQHANPQRHTVQPVFLFIQSRDECRVRFLKSGTEGFYISGTCAAAGVAAVMNGLTERELVLQFRSENVFFQWLPVDNNVYVTAAPRYVYSGDYDFDESTTGGSI